MLCRTTTFSSLSVPFSVYFVNICYSICGRRKGARSARRPGRPGAGATYCDGEHARAGHRPGGGAGGGGAGGMGGAGAGRTRGHKK